MKFTMVGVAVMMKVRIVLMVLSLLTMTACNKLCIKGFGIERKETPCGRLDVLMYESSDSWDCNKNPGFYRINISLMDVPDDAKAKSIEMRCVLSRKRDESDIVFEGDWLGEGSAPKLHARTWFIGSYDRVFLQFEDYHLVVWCRIDFGEGAGEPFVIQEVDAIAHQTKRNAFIDIF